MKFLADENIGLEVVEFLRKEHHDIDSISEISPGTSDIDILTKATKEQRIIITTDTDFGELIYHAGHSHVGVVLLRLEDQRNANKILILKKLLKQYEKELPGNFVVATETAVRIRRNPTP